MRLTKRSRHSEDRHQLVTGSSGLVERRFLFRCEFDFDDLLDAARPELYRNADYSPLNAVLTFEASAQGRIFFCPSESPRPSSTTSVMARSTLNPFFNI